MTPSGGYRDSLPAQLKYRWQEIGYLRPNHREDLLGLTDRVANIRQLMRGEMRSKRG